MTTAAANTLTLNSNWLDASTTTVPAGDFHLANNTSFCYNGYWYPWYTPAVYTFSYGAPAKIRLKLSEVERLREAARGDEALRATLNKFTPHIVVEVDF